MQRETLPPQVEETVRMVDQMRVDHNVNATSVDRILDKIKSRISAPSFVLLTAMFVAIWIISNLMLQSAAWDPVPFAYLDLTLSTLAFLVTVLILATQRRADALAGHREQLILQLAFLSEQKIAKIIGLLEELRRDSPQIRDRTDHVADQMKKNVDARAVSDALRDAAEA